jgi:ferredoxin
MAKFKIIHERPDCIACGACVAAAPDHWEMNENDGLADLKGADTVGENQEKIIDESELAPNQEAAQCCPVQIIHIKKVEEEKEG